MDERNVINRETLNIRRASFTKREAAEDMKELYECLYDMVEFHISSDKKMKLSKRDRLEKIRNRMGILKDCEIIITN